MTEVRFYHLQRSTLEQALPGLLEKCLERGWKAVVVCPTAERVEEIDRHLWTYDPGSFLPHGTANDGRPADQPVWLTIEDENPNGATVLFLAEGAGSDRVGTFDLACELFDGNDPQAVATARERWKLYKDQGHNLTYWQQTPQGWEKKA